MQRDFRISKPAGGRYFPLSAAEIAERVDALALKARWADRPITIFAENCDVVCARGHPLCAFIRERYIAVFSLPDEIPAALAKQAMALAMEKFAAIDRGPHLSVKEQQFVVYRAYLGALGELSITQHTVNGVSRSYLRQDDARRPPRGVLSPKVEKELFSMKIS